VAKAWVDLGTRRRNIALRVYARDQQDPCYTCPKCGRSIDWGLPYKDPDTGQVNLWSKSIDHIEELQDGGELLDLANCWTAHLTCNASKGATRRHQRQREERAAHTPTPLHIDPHTL
jgi:5-methylcytosine-specific restriction endonuclease McrA